MTKASFHRLRSVLGALVVLVAVALCAGLPGAYLMHSAVTSYQLLEAGGQAQLFSCEGHAFTACGRFASDRG